MLVVDEVLKCDRPISFILSLLLMFVKGSSLEFTGAIGGRARIIELRYLVVSVRGVIRSAYSAPQVRSCFKDSSSVAPGPSVDFLLHRA